MTFRRVGIGLGCGLLMAGLLIVALRSLGWNSAIHATLHVAPGALGVALGATSLSMILNGVVWAHVLRRLGYGASVQMGLALYAATGLAAYISTGAGAVGGCMLLLHRRGVCAGRAALFLGIASLIGFCGSLVWAPCGVALLAAPAAIHALPALGGHALVVAIVVTIVCAVGTLVSLWLATLAPRLGLRWRIARFAADPAAPPMQLHLRHLLALIPVATLSWLVGAVPLWVVVQTMAPGATSLPAVIAVQSVATVVGGIAFFLPNGLGARDGTTVALLAGALGVPIPAAAAAGILVRLCDPLAKALILLVLAIVGRLPMRVCSLAASWRAAGTAVRSVLYRRALGTLRSDTTHGY